MECRRKREAGVVQIIVLGALVTLIGAAALALDSGLLMATRAQLQVAADAGAQAAIIELRNGAPLDHVAQVASDVSNLNWSAYGDGTATSPVDVTFGAFDLDTGAFVPGGTAGATAVEVTAQRQADLVFAPVLSLLGLVVGDPQVSASGVAAMGERDVVLVQDVTLSFVEEIDEAREALGDFTMAMVNQSLSGDRIGLVTFAEGATGELDLTPIPGQMAEVLDAIDTFSHCTSATPACTGTHIAPGINEAMQQFSAQSSDANEQVIILVSDGVPCLPNDPNETLSRREAARAAAEAADAAGVNIYSVFLDKPISGNVYCWGVSNSIADPDLMEELVAGTGQFYETPDEEDLDDILLSIVRGLPVKLVR